MYKWNALNLQDKAFSCQNFRSQFCLLDESYK